ncbi:hypothetical protein J3A84_10580 [Proteiniclasticum sp. SCR006]|uniref:DUF3999 family protein n=1 Tax=Proteiniclasticum aestuarii TaxID=2817862 RepID=A0A939HCJ6_9CLOT|nr:hypothetical protein [Proteiniclasticum aestuarii]MBO1265477.1 hypothetical protein [Proteiniclasticum aestuarii]
MKRIAVCLMLFLYLSSSIITVSANSGPVTWYHYPGISMITIDEDSPITVIKEDLHFDFSEEKENDFTRVGKVSARYTMRNTEAESTVSRMVFPFIRNLWNRDEDQVEVLLDGKPVDYEIYYGKEVEEVYSEDQFKEKVELEDILESVTGERYVPVNFHYEEVGHLYRIQLDSDREEDLHVDASFTLSDRDSRLFTRGNNSYGYDNDTNEFVIGTWLGGEHTSMDIFSLDEEMDIEVKGYASGVEDAPEVKDFTYEIVEEEMSLETYYREFLSADEYISGSVFIPEDHNIYYEVLDEALERERLVTVDHISSLLTKPRYVLIAYEVPFEGLEEKEVEVRYAAMGSMDRSETVEPTYTYEYFLHPAKYWKDFQDLTIRVTPSESYPYIIESNLALTREDDGTYIGTFSTLPEEDLRFTLFEKEEITAMDKVKGNLARNTYLLYFGGAALLGLMTLFLAGLLIRRAVNSSRRKHQ